MDTKRTKGLNALNDRISELPDEILSVMLLLLPMKEATRTSILSRGWRFRWKRSMEFCSTLCLDVVSMNGIGYPEKMFGYIEDHGSYIIDSSLLSIERNKFVGWVDKILQLDYRPVMDAFRLRYHFEKEFSPHIDQWISMGISKRVQHFEIDLYHFHKWGIRFLEADLYKFPHWLFAQEAACLVKRLYLKWCLVMSPLDYSRFSFSSLLDLQLDRVLIDTDGFCIFFSNCSNLEKLRSVCCPKLVSLNISGSFLNLKYLAIFGCYRLKSVVIAAKNLSRFDYNGNLSYLSLQNAPQLSDVTFHGNTWTYSNTVDRVIEKFCTLPSVESLMLSVDPTKNPKVSRKYTKLKKLVLLIGGFKGPLWGLEGLFHAFPCLEKIELSWLLIRNVEACKKGLQIKSLCSSLAHLKDIIISVFLGSAHEIEFTAYLVSNAPSLKKLTVYFKSKINYCYLNGAYQWKIRREESDVQQAKQQLLNVVPPQSTENALFPSSCGLKEVGSTLSVTAQEV